MTPSALRALPVAPAPAPESVPAPRAKATAAHPFAEMLRQNRAAAATPSARAATSTPPQKSDDRHAPAQAPAQNESTTTDPAAPQRDAGQTKGRGAGATREAASTTKAAAPTSDAPADEAAARASDDKNAATSPPDASLIAGAVVNTGPGAAPAVQAEAADAATAARNQGAAAIDAGRTDASAAQGASLSPLGDGGTPGALGRPGADRDVASNGKDEAIATSDASDAPTLDAPASASFAAMLAESKTSHATTLVAHTNNDAATATPQSTGFVTGTAPSTAGVASAALPVPLHSPEFAAAFGVQVSVLAKDGVQRAELHLNPAEMGPVSIQITLDGTQARVDFGADAAATRHAIEAGLPELASALRDAGFTLAGGGVAQHSASPGGGNNGDADGDRAASSRSSTAQSGELEATAARQTRRVAAGGVDLYA